MVMAKDEQDGFHIYAYNISNPKHIPEIIYHDSETECSSVQLLGEKKVIWMDRGAILNILDLGGGRLKHILI